MSIYEKEEGQSPVYMCISMYTREVWGKLFRF